MNRVISSAVDARSKIYEIELEADSSKLPEVAGFIETLLDREEDCSLKARMQIAMAVEEIFVNISSYAYTPGKGSAIIRAWTEEDPKAFCVSFSDRGIPFDPLKKEDPNVTLSASERKIGGLGVFLVKKSMDDVLYRYEDGWNILTIKKNL